MKFAWQGAYLSGCMGIAGTDGTRWPMDTACAAWEGHTQPLLCDDCTDLLSLVLIQPSSFAHIAMHSLAYRYFAVRFE